MSMNACRLILAAAIAGLAPASPALAQTTAPDWEDPEVVGINKLPYHATLQLPSREAECKEIVSLDGQWLFHWSANPDERPADFFSTGVEVLVRTYSFS